jgi:TPR repeat protein
MAVQKTMTYKVENKNQLESKETLALKKIAKKGDVKAQYALWQHCFDMAGRAAARGIGGALLYMCEERAKKWLLKCAESGYADAQYDLGTLCETGSFKMIKKDLNRAKELYEKSAAQGNAKAKEKLDIEYFNQQMQQAKLGNKAAQNNVANCYESGKGTEINLNKAALWYGEVAKQGDADAQCKLGSFYEYGRGVAQDFEQAKLWYKKSVANGCGQAKFNLDELLKKEQRIQEKQRQQALELEKQRVLEVQRQEQERQRALEEERQEKIRRNKELEKAAADKMLREQLERDINSAEKSFAEKNYVTALTQFSRLLQARNNQITSETLSWFIKRCQAQMYLLADSSNMSPSDKLKTLQGVKDDLTQCFEFNRENATVESLLPQVTSDIEDVKREIDKIQRDQKIKEEQAKADQERIDAINKEKQLQVQKKNEWRQDLLNLRSQWSNENSSQILAKYDQLIQQYFDDADGYFERGSFCLVASDKVTRNVQKQGFLNKAKSDLNRVIEIDPGNDKAASQFEEVERKLKALNTSSSGATDVLSSGEVPKLQEVIDGKLSIEQQAKLDAIKAQYRNNLFNPTLANTFSGASKKGVGFFTNQSATYASAPKKMPMAPMAMVPKSGIKGFSSALAKGPSFSSSTTN